MQRNVTSTLNSSLTSANESNTAYNWNNDRSNHRQSTVEHHTDHLLSKSSPTNPKYVYYRVFGYSVTALVHAGDSLAMALALRGPVMNEPNIALFYSMQFFYITIWNLIFQLMYVGLGLGCDLPVVLKLKENKILNSLRRYREIYYHGVLWPFCVIIFCVYWPIYIYDRNLVFPDYIDKVLSQVSNYILHMFIVYPVLWDLFFLPTRKLTSHKYVFLTVTIYILYLISMFALYAQRGVWPYPLMKFIYGTLYLPVFLTVITLLFLLIYYIQWPIRSYVWQKIET